MTAVIQLSLMNPIRSLSVSFESYFKASLGEDFCLFRSNTHYLLDPGSFLSHARATVTRVIFMPKSLDDFKKGQCQTLVLVSVSCLLEYAVIYSRYIADFFSILFSSGILTYSKEFSLQPKVRSIDAKRTDVTMIYLCLSYNAVVVVFFSIHRTINMRSVAISIAFRYIFNRGRF